MSVGHHRLIAYNEPFPSRWLRPRVGQSCATTKLLLDGFSTKITRVRQELHMLVHPSSIDLSSRTLRFLTGPTAESLDGW